MNYDDHDRWRRRYFAAMHEWNMATWLMRWMLALLSVLLLAGNRFEFRCGRDGITLVIEPAQQKSEEEMKHDGPS